MPAVFRPPFLIVYRGAYLFGSELAKKAGGVKRGEANR